MPPSCKPHGKYQKQRKKSPVTHALMVTEAIMTAMSASVTVSMGELTTGDASLISRVNCVARETYNIQCLVCQGLPAITKVWVEVPRVPQSICVRGERSHRHMCR